MIGARIVATTITGATADDLAIALAIDPPLRGVPGFGATPIPVDWPARCRAGSPPAGCNSAYIALDATMYISDLVQAGVANVQLVAALGLDPVKVAAFSLQITTSVGTSTNVGQVSLGREA